MKQQERGAHYLMERFRNCNYLSTATGEVTYSIRLCVELCLGQPKNTEKTEQLVLATLNLTLQVHLLQHLSADTKQQQPMFTS